MSDKPEEIVIQQSRVNNLIAVLAFAIAVGAGVYGYLELTRNHASLEKMVTVLHDQVSSHQQTMASLQESVTNIKNNSADFTKWSVMEAQYLTRLAQDQFELTHDTHAASIFLQQALAIIEKINHPMVLSIRQALGDNIDQLTSQPPVSAEQLYLKMMAVDHLIDSLPLPPTPLQVLAEADQKQKNDSNLPWWKVKWRQSMEALKKIVIVRYDGSNDMPLILPEEKMFLYQNLHAQMEEAMLSVLNHSEAVYQASLQRATTWVKKYFMQDADVTMKVLAELQVLQAVNLKSPAVNFAATMQAFDQYLGQSEPLSVETH